MADQSLRDLRVGRPIIGFAGFNPRCGEHGLMGREEIDCIIPAVEEARQLGIEVEGPIPGDIIVGKGIAEPSTIVEAIKVAPQFAAARQENRGYEQ